MLIVGCCEGVYGLNSPFIPNSFTTCITATQTVMSSAMEALSYEQARQDIVLTYDTLVLGLVYDKLRF
jgi:hypothetical protein